MGKTVYEGQESARDFQKDRAAVERELRKAAAERDRALEQADAEAAREGQPVQLRQKQTEIWEQYEEKRYDILTQSEDKREPTCCSGHAGEIGSGRRSDEACTYAPPCSPSTPDLSLIAVPE